jgi:hypothetical protein
MSVKKIFDNNMLCCYKNFISLKNITFKYLFLLIIFSLTIVPSLAILPHGNQSVIPGNKTCSDCHAPHQTMNITSESSRIIKADSKSNSIQSFTATSVEGNITLISSLGQNWYQQGIYGPNSSYDKSWGWTFFDENPPSGFIIPNESVTQRENIYALLLDDGNNSTPISGATVVADVTYWTYDNVSYKNHTLPVQLAEDTNRKGFYSGRFDFYGGTSYAGYGMRSCDGCHISIFGLTDTQIGYFPGNYTVSIRAQADGKIKFTNSNFEVTPWGCEDCHGSGNRHRASADMDSACYMCHGINNISGMSDAGNPHQITAHININCTDCHTNKSLNPQTFDGVTFGGLNGNKPQYNSNTIQLNGGTHSALACTDCHKSLSLPETPGGYGSYTVSDTVNSYDPSFASLEQFEDYYVINVISSSDPLSLSLDWNSAANLGFYLYPPDFDPKNRSRPPYYNGDTSSNKPEIYINSAPMVGKWILQVYGYDLKYDFPGWNTWGGVLQPPINYTVISTYPIQKKDLPSTPECKNCHYSGAIGGANTTFEIPDWNPGFAHVDTNGDGTLDIQCRMCHDSMHDIVIKTCQNCHTTAPTNHPIRDPAFTQYTRTQCLACHGDPHRVTLTGGTDCIGCHATGEVNIDVNISLFGNHSKINDSNGAGIVTNDDCWTCHYQKDMDKNHIYLCGSCHSNNTGIVPIANDSLVMKDFMHDSTECRTCHAPKVSGYHLRGTVGPLGTVEKILRKIQNP